MEVLRVANVRFSCLIGGSSISGDTAIPRCGSKVPCKGSPMCLHKAASGEPAPGMFSRSLALVCETTYCSSKHLGNMCTEMLASNPGKRKIRGQ